MSGQAKRMRVVISGAGKVGRHVARDLKARGHDVTIIEQSKEKVDALREQIDVNWILGDACELHTLDAAILSSADVALAATGDDEDNLVTSLLAKQEFAVPRVVGRVNHPDNEWLFTEAWGVDIALSTPHLLTSVVEEAVSVGDLVKLLRLERGKVSLVELTLAEGSPADGKTVKELSIPPDCTIVALVRDEHVIAPSAETSLHAGDEVLALTSVEAERDLLRALAGE